MSVTHWRHGSCILDYAEPAMTLSVMQIRASFGVTAAQE